MQYQSSCGAFSVMPFNKVAATMIQSGPSHALDGRNRLIAWASIIFDHVTEADGSRRAVSPGGAGLFAALAMAPWAGETQIVAGVGRDFASLAGGLLEAHGVGTGGLVERDAHSIQSQLQYRNDGSRSETPVFGDDHFARLQVAADEIPENILPATGTYIFQDVAIGFWEGVRVRREVLGEVLWELHEGATQAGWHAGLRAAARSCAIVSLNKAEATRLFGPADGDLELLARAATAFGTCVALRVGDKGAYLATNDALLRIPPVAGPVVDVTGGGNAFSGGLLAGHCERPGDWAHAARCAAVSAAVAIVHRGAPAPLSHAARDAMYARATIERIQP